MQVLGQEICFRSSQYDDLFELFHSRQRMHRKVKAGKGRAGREAGGKVGLGRWGERRQGGRGEEGRQCMMTLHHTAALLMPSSPIGVHPPPGQECGVHRVACDNDHNKPFMHQHSS